MPDDEPHEQQLINVLVDACPAMHDALTIGPGDDAAWVRDGRVITVDTMVEGVHWDDRLSAEDVGWKLVAVNASDLGAMGARPRWAVLSMALPQATDKAWVHHFARGLSMGLRHFGMDLAGGDTVRSNNDQIVVTLTAGGEAHKPVRRAGGRPGHPIFVTGVLGGAAAGLQSDKATLLKSLARPAPPVGFAVALADNGLAQSMMDLSDGLSADLPRLCRASRCGARIDSAKLPTHPDMPHRKRGLALTGGEDYELLFTVEEEDIERLLSLARSHNVQVTQIGRLTEDDGPKLLDGSWPAPDFAHFEPIDPASEGAA